MNRIVRSIKKGARCWAGIFLSALLMFTMYACTGKAQELESSVKNESFASESVNLGENDSPAVSSEEDRLQERGILREELSRKRSRYESLEYWACLEKDSSKPADVFLLSPTVDMGTAGNYNLSLEDAGMKEKLKGAMTMQRGIYDGTARVFSPYYREAAFSVYSLPKEEAEPYFEIAYEDVKEAFLYYMENYNGGRPFFLAGFSQGSDMVLRLLKDVFQQEEYRELLIAAYCPGWRVTEKDLEEAPWLKMAQGETDLGVIISYNTEAVEVEDSLMVPLGEKALSINPLNWKTDGTSAGRSENLGACFINSEGRITSEIPQLTGAYLDLRRGTLKVPDIKEADYLNSSFPEGVYHLYDYMFFYRNLQKNVGDRYAAYQESASAAVA